MNMLFRGSTVGDRGSLFHVKNKFAYQTVKKKISDCINSVVDFFNFVTEGCVCMIVCQMINIENIDALQKAFQMIQNKEKNCSEISVKKLLLFHGPK